MRLVKTVFPSPPPSLSPFFSAVNFSSNNKASPAAKMSHQKERIFAHFLLFLLWITDSYLNSPWNKHQMDKESYVAEQNESHNDFYLHNATTSKHLGFGTVAIHATLTSNPKLKNKAPAGKLDRRTIILLFLMLSGDVELNPGPLELNPGPTKQPTTQTCHDGKI